MNFIKELFPLVITSLMQRAIFLNNNRLLGSLANPLVERYNSYFPLIASAFIFEVAIIAVINSSFLGVDQKNLRKALGQMLYLNSTLIVVTVILSLTCKHELFSILKISSTITDSFDKSFFLIIFVFCSFISFSIVEGFLILVKKTNLLLLFLVIMTVTNYLFGYFFVTKTTQPVEAILSGTGSIYLLATLFGLGFLYISSSAPIITINHIKKKPYVIWASEISIAIVRSIAPFGVSYFMVRALNSMQLLTSYSMSLQLSYLAALPFLAGYPLAIRNETQWQSLIQKKESFTSVFLVKSFLRYSIFPSIFALSILAIFPAIALSSFFSYEIDPSLVSFLRLFFIANIVGQFGHYFAIPIRANGKTFLVTISLIFSELFVQLLSFSLLLFSQRLNPYTVGLTIVLFTGCYLLLNYLFFLRIKNRIPA